MNDGRRTQKLASLIRGELARVLIEEVSDPTLKEITITDVNLSNDLQHAKVFFTHYGPEMTPKQDKDIARGFSRAAPFFRRRIGEHLQLRYVPELDFRRDLHGDSVNRLLHIMDGVAVAGEAGPGLGPKE